MTPPTDAASRTSITEAPPAGKPRRSPADVLADPRVRLAAGSAALLVTAMAVRREHVGPGEAAAFRAINGLPGWLYPPAWAVMQLGTLGAAPAAAGAAWLARDRELAGRLLAGGTSAWVLSKVVKRLVRRPRPAILLADTRRHGREAAGLGYLSGHAGVAVALGAAALPRVNPVGRALILGTVPAVGLTRIYVGAHLPLDVVGGAALGLTIDGASTLVSRSHRRSAPRTRARRGVTLGPARGCTGYPGLFFLTLILMVVAYLLLIEVGKHWFYRSYRAPAAAAVPRPVPRRHRRVHRRAARFTTHLRLRR